VARYRAHIKSDGFGVVLSPQLPGLLHQELRLAVEGFLQRHGLERDDFCGFHPLGALGPGFSAYFAALEL
jgi:predicted naringenin-chalcone synthase